MYCFGHFELLQQTANAAKLCAWANYFFFFSIESFISSTRFEIEFKVTIKLNHPIQFHFTDGHGPKRLHFAIWQTISGINFNINDTQHEMKCVDIFLSIRFEKRKKNCIDSLYVEFSM